MVNLLVMIENPQQHDAVFMPGIVNRLIRYWFYLNAGLNIVNNFRNLILAILGIYIALHLTDWWMLPAMFIPSVLILTIMGYYVVHKVNKVSEWLGVRFSSHYGLRQYNFTQEQNELLKEIRDLLKHG